MYREASWISPFLVVDGELAGVWEHTKEKGRLHVEGRPFRTVDPVIAKLATAEAERLARYLGLSTDVTVGGFVAGRGRKNLRRSSARREAPA